MPELSVVIVASDNEQRTVPSGAGDGTSVARTVHTCAQFSVAAADPINAGFRPPIPMSCWWTLRQIIPAPGTARY